MHVIEPDARHGNGPDGLGGRRCVPATPKPALKNGNVHAGLGKDDHGRNRERVELGYVIGTLPRRRASGVHALAGDLCSRDAMCESIL